MGSTWLTSARESSVRYMAKNVAWSATPSTSHGFESAEATMPPTRVAGASVRSPIVHSLREHDVTGPADHDRDDDQDQGLPQCACLPVVGLRRLENAAAQAIDGAGARRRLGSVAHHHHRGAGARAPAQGKIGRAHV